MAHGSKTRMLHSLDLATRVYIDARYIDRPMCSLNVLLEALSFGYKETQVDDAKDAATQVFLSPLPAFQPSPIFEAYWVKAKRDFREAHQNRDVHDKDPTRERRCI